MESSRILFHEIQVFYLDFWCPKLYLEFSLEFSLGYIAHGLKYLSRLF